MTEHQIVNVSKQSNIPVLKPCIVLTGKYNVDKLELMPPAICLDDTCIEITIINTTTYRQTFNSSNASMIDPPWYIDPKKAKKAIWYPVLGLWYPMD